MLYEHPAVVEAAVIGVPHPTLGEEVGAAVALKPRRERHPGGAARVRQGAGRGLQVPAPRVAGRRRCPRGRPARSSSARSRSRRRLTRTWRRGHERDGTAARRPGERRIATGAPERPRPRSTCCSPRRRSARLRRFFPGRSALRFAAGARRPARGLAAGRAEPGRRTRPHRGRHVDVRRPRGTGGSPTPRGGATRCCAGSCRPTWRPATPPAASSADADSTGATRSGCGSRWATWWTPSRRATARCCHPGRGRRRSTQAAAAS